LALCNISFSTDALLFLIDVSTLLLLSHFTFNLLNYDDRLNGTHIAGPWQDVNILHAVRCLLALRLWKVHGKIEKRMGWRIQSQTLRNKLGVLQVVFLILLCCHIGACGFYAVGIIYDGQDRSWVEVNLVGKQLGIKYAQLLQWSLAQFTLGTTEVHAGNFAEHAYSASISLIAAFLLVLLFGRLVGSALELENATNGKKRQQLSTLMEYLLQCRVPAPLRSRIWATATQRAGQVAACGERVHEEGVTILTCLPQELRAELHTSVYSPTFLRHPFFRELEQGPNNSFACGHAFRALPTVITEVALFPDQVLFSPGHAGKQMYFTVQGELGFSMSGGALQPPSMANRAGPWFSEPPLWISWRHRGKLTALVRSELFSLEAKGFQELMMEEPRAAALCRRYARAFAIYVKQCQGQLTDICIDSDALDTLVSSVWEGPAPPCVTEPSNRLPDVAEYRLQLSDATPTPKRGVAWADVNPPEETLADRSRPRSHSWQAPSPHSLAVPPLMAAYNSET